MRPNIRQALKDHEGVIAAVVGAWHVGALALSHGIGRSGAHPRPSKDEGQGDLGALDRQPFECSPRAMARA